MNKHEEILSKYVENPLWQNVVGSEIVTKENALKAMQEAVEDYINTLDRLLSKSPSLREQPLREAARTALEGDGVSDEEVREIEDMANLHYSDMNAMEFGEWIAANDFIVIGPLKKMWGAKDSWNKFLGYHSAVSTKELYEIFKKHEREEFNKRVEERRNNPT